MNRRDFIRALITIPLAAKLPNIDTPLISSTRIEEYNDFVTYVTWTMNMYVYQPSKCIRITNIGEEEMR